MLKLALQDESWDVVMTGLNLINPSARQTVLAAAQVDNVWVLIVFVVRRALSNPDVVRDLVLELVSAGEVDSTAIDLAAPLDFLLADGGRQPDRSRLSILSA